MSSLTESGMRSAAVGSLCLMLAALAGCVASAGPGLVTTRGTGTWGRAVTVPGLPEGFSAVTSVSCVSGGDCLAGGSSGGGIRGQRGRRTLGCRAPDSRDGDDQLGLARLAGELRCRRYDTGPQNPYPGVRDQPELRTALHPRHVQSAGRQLRRQPDRHQPARGRQSRRHRRPGSPSGRLRLAELLVSIPARLPSVQPEVSPPRIGRGRPANLLFRHWL